jgi:lysophospholipase L1-like esterase
MTSLWQYERNLDQMVQRLRATGTTLIWAQTTAVPEVEAGRFIGDDRKYNEAAATVMKKYDIMIDDLHTLTQEFSP